MGIVDKFIRNPFKKSVDKEMEKIVDELIKTGKIYTADELTKKEIGKIRREAAENVLKRNVKIAAGVGITCSLIGAAYVLGGSKETEDPLKDELSGQVTTVEETASNRENQPETKSELDMLLDEIDAIDSPEDTLSFFKKMYVEQYNKEHNTNLTEKDIEISTQNQAWMYNIGDKCVTRGSYPQSVENKLESNNIEYEKQEKLKLYNVDLITENGKETLESTTIQDSNVKKVVLGDEYLDGKSLDSSDINTLCDLTKVMNDVVDLVTIYKNNPNNKEAQIAIVKGRLGEKVTEYKDMQIQEKIEEDIQKGVR